MSRRVWRVAVALVIVGFVLIAAHAPLLGERISDQQNCPLCQWLQHLTQGIVPTIVIAIGPVVGPSLPESCPDSFQKPHYWLFTARSPPCS